MESDRAHNTSAKCGPRCPNCHASTGRRMPGGCSYCVQQTTPNADDFQPGTRLWAAVQAWQEAMGHGATLQHAMRRALEAADAR